MKIVFIGSKGAGKSVVGAAFSERRHLLCHETDRMIEERDGQGRTCREIFQQDGEEAFRDIEKAVAQDAARLDWCVVVTGGGLMMDSVSRRALRHNAILVYLHAEQSLLWERATASGLPPWLEAEGGAEKFAEQVAYRDEVLLPFADVVVDATNDTPEAIAEAVAELVAQELTVRCRSANTYGDIIRMTGFGESHGPAIGVVLEGLQPGIPFSEDVIQVQMDRRRPGQSKVVTQRKEADKVEILSGVFEGKTTGAPIALLIRNQDQRSKNYDNIVDVFRPGHGDFTFYQKYGLRDHRGGGRQSGRETACRVAAGAVPLNILAERGVRIVAHAVEVAGIKAECCNYDTIEENPIRCADPVAAKKMEEAVLAARTEKDSVGGIIQLDVIGLPPGIGDPIFGKLDARLVSAIMTIGAIKGVEVGDGFALTRLRGSEANDSMGDGDFLSNHAGGILGGISTGQPLLLRVAVKPTASIAKPQRTIDLAGKNREIEVLGRHDPCIVPRAVPVIECVAALVLLDAWEVQRRLNPDWEKKRCQEPFS